jgi:hypothetical protein
LDTSVFPSRRWPAIADGFGRFSARRDPLHFGGRDQDFSSVPNDPDFAAFYRAPQLHNTYAQRVSRLSERISQALLRTCCNLLHRLLTNTRVHSGQRKTDTIVWYFSTAKTKVNRC